MKKLILYPLIIISFLLLTIFIFLSTIGYETSKLNGLIQKEAKKIDDSLNFNLKKIKIKIDPKNFNLYLTVKNPNIVYKDIELSVKEIKTFVKLTSILSINLKINKVFIEVGKTPISQIKKIIIAAKPSNLKDYVLNNVENGNLSSNLDLELDDKFNLIDYKISGYANNIIAKIYKNKKIENLNFKYQVSKNTGLIENIEGNSNGIKINEGEIKYLNNDSYKIEANIQSSLNLNTKKLKNYFQSSNYKKYLTNKILLDATLNHNINLVLDNSLKLKNYEYKVDGNISEFSFAFQKEILFTLLKKKIKDIEIENSKISFNKSNNKKSILNLSGKYRLNDYNKNFQKFELNNIISGSNHDLDLDLDVSNALFISLINYEKPKNKIARIKTKIRKRKDFLYIDLLDYKYKKDFIELKKLKFNTNKYILDSLDSLNIKTNSGNNKKNELKILFNKDIKISGKHFDASNLIKNINKKDKKNYLKKINKKITIKLDNINTKFSETLKNFNLYGELLNGNIYKINSKGDFEENKHLEISLKTNKTNKKRYLEIYSDMPEPLLSDYKFFKGLKGGKLIYTSEIGKGTSSSNLTIENFKVIDAPGFVKLLSLADLKGMEDALKGDGLSFEIMEIKFNKNQDALKLEELYAIGKSISILMEGYVEEKSGLISLRGTMIPAKMLNNFLSKIPVVGKILIPKEIGEGLFGVSFKMKGLPGDVKTTVNPIKTLTPRFITKALEKRKTK